MARNRKSDHKLLRREADERQRTDKDQAREASRPDVERHGQGGRAEDTGAAAVASEFPTDPETQKGEEFKAEQDGDLLDVGGDDDFLASGEPEYDPEHTRMIDPPGQGEGIDDPRKAVAKLPDSVEEHQRRVAEAYGSRDGGAPYADRAENQLYRSVPPDMDDLEISAAAGRNFVEEPTHLLRHADAGDLDTVHLDRRWGIDATAPKAGEDGGAPLGEPTDQKHDPGAPWPGPLQSLAQSPTPSPEPGPEPSVQLEPPQPVRHEHKPEAAVGLVGPSAAEQAQRQADARERSHDFSRQRIGAAPDEVMLKRHEADNKSYRDNQTAIVEQDHPVTNKPRRDDGIPRDEANQVRLDHLTEVAIAAIGAEMRKAGEEAQPYRIRIALENAARKVMSAQWWDYKSKHFDLSIDI